MSRKDEILLVMRRAKGKPKGTQMSSQLRKAYGCKQGEVASKQPEIVKKIKKKLLMKRPHSLHGNQRASLPAMENAIAEHLAGETQEFVKEKYHVDVRAAMKMYFGAQTTRESILEEILLDNALISAVQFQKGADQLNARDAAVAAGIFTQKFSEFKRARQSGHQPDIPINLILQLNQTLENVKKVHGEVIELEE